MDNSVEPSEAIFEWQDLLRAGAIAFVISLLFPSVGGGKGGAMFGWESLYVSLMALSGYLGPRTDMWLVIAGIANILLLALPILIIFKPKIVGVSTLLAAVFCVFVTASFIFWAGFKDLFIGYYIWLASALLTLSGTFYGYRAKRAVYNTSSMPYLKGDE